MAVDPRRGLNCTLSYVKSDPSGKAGDVVRTMRLRVDLVRHGIEMVAAESTARNARAYYPHRMTPSQFAIRVLLKGFAERRAFSAFMLGYADYVMNPGLPGGAKFPDMVVLVPSRNFHREGVPLTGFDRGDNVGAILWTPIVTFETTREPQDTETWATSRFVSAQDPDMKYFWPNGTQLGGNAVPSGNYTNIIDGSDGGSDSGQTEPSVPMPNEGTSPSERYDYGD